MQNYKIALKPSETGSFNWETVFDCATKAADIKSIENQMASATFWDNSENAQQVVGQLKSLKAIHDPWNDAEAASEDLTVLIEMAEEDPAIEEEIAAEVQRLETQGTSMLHAFRVALAIIFNPQHQITVFFARNKPYLAFGITDGVVDGVVEYAGQQVLVEKAIDVICGN